MYSLLEFPPLVQSGGMWIEDFMKSICETLHIVLIEIHGFVLYLWHAVQNGEI